MFPASSIAGGNCFAFPDTCLTPAPPAPPIPIPYPNTGQLMMATQTPTKVMIENMPVINIDSEIPQTMGDEAGVAGGVASGMNMGPAKFTLGSPKVKVEGSPIVRMTSMTGHNGSSANIPAGTVVAPSQVKVLVM